MCLNILGTNYIHVDNITFVHVSMNLGARTALTTGHMHWTFSQMLEPALAQCRAQNWHFPHWQ